MKTKELREVIACLPQGRTLFRYFKDDYAFRLLSRVAGQFATLGEMRKSRYGKLLEKPAVKEWMARYSSAHWFGPAFGAGHTRPLDYVLTLDEWGDDDSSWVWDQTSRRGKSLVLQLNLTRSHQLALRRLMRGETGDPFHWSGHPAQSGKNATLAWARIDFDLRSGDALIEEIQSDRIREVKEALSRQACRSCRRIHFKGHRLERARLDRFWLEEMSPHEKVWPEAMMMATLDFLFDEIGVRRVFYHTFETGCYLKGIDGTPPPRSLYTTLPRKFCFQETSEMPEFLEKARLKKRRLRALGDRGRFFVMER